MFDLATARCYLECMTLGTVPSGNQCVQCQSSCLTCSLAPTNCTSCDITSLNPYLNNNKCLSICPQFYYASNNTYTCVLCTPPCETCTSGSISSCVTCQTGHYLFGTTCTPTCPNLYYENVF